MDYQKELVAERAKAIIQEEVFDFFLDSFKEQLALKIIHSTPEQKEEREEWYLLNRCVNGLKSKLQEYANEYDMNQEIE